MIYLGADHGGFKLKEQLEKWFAELKLEFLDVGAAKLDPNDDYPQFAFKVAQLVSAEEINQVWSKRPKGILICRSAAGMVIAANKIKNIRAVAIFDIKMAKHAREHNDANIIGISADWTSEKEAKEIINTWLTTEFSKAERHTRRIKQIAEVETDQQCACGNNCC